MTTPAGTPTPSQFTYKLNAMENAGAQITPAKHGYKEKREAVLAYVANIEAELTALRAAHEAAQAEIAVSDKLLAERNRVLAAIPECDAHGEQCVPHALEWIASVQAELEQERKAHKQTSRQANEAIETTNQRAADLQARLDRLEQERKAREKADQFAAEETMRCLEAEQRAAELTAELEGARELETMRAAAISTAALMNTRQSDPPLPRDHPYWTIAYQDVLDAVGREITWRERAEKAERGQRELCVAIGTTADEWAFSNQRSHDAEQRAVDLQARLNDAIRALAAAGGRESVAVTKESS